METKGYIFNVTPPMKKDNSELVEKFRAFDLDAFDDAFKNEVFKTM